MGRVALIATSIICFVAHQLFSFNHAVDSAGESEETDETSPFQNAATIHDGEGDHSNEDKHTKYWNHSAKLIGNCNTPSNFLLNWQPIRLEVCTEGTDINEEGHLLSVIQLGGNIDVSNDLCNWLICPMEHELVQVTLDFTELPRDAIGALAGYISICGNYKILENGTLQCREAKDISQQIIQTFIFNSTVALMSLSRVPERMFAEIQILNYDPTCGGIYIHESSGTIESPGHPNYKAFHCRYRFIVAPDERINFTVAHFAISSRGKLCEEEKMIVRDGLDLTFPYTNIYCDENPPPGIFLSQTNYVEISISAFHNFWNNYKDSYKIFWFAVSVQAVSTWNTSNQNTSGISEDNTRYGFADSESISVEDFESRQTCDGLLVDREGLIKLEYPHAFQDGVTCTWLLHAGFRNVIDKKTEHVRFLLPLFQEKVDGKRNCSDQSLEIFEGCKVDLLKTDCRGGQITKYCGDMDYDEWRPTSFSGISIKIRFSRKVYVERDRIGHFQYLDFNPEASCPLSYDSDGGTLMTPGYPNSSPAFFECNWEIIVPSGFRFRFTFHNFLNADEYKYFGDSYLEFSFRDGLDLPLPGFKDILEYKKESNSFSSISNHVGFRFRSGYTSPDKKRMVKIGWKTEKSGCNESINSYSGIIASPGYPNHIKRGTVCTWNITVTPGHFIKVTFVEIDLKNSDDFSCKNNFVKIIDGSIEDDMKFDKICTTRAVSTVTTKTNFVQIVLNVSYEKLNGNGIKFRYEAVCNMQNKRFDGWIQSINFPDAYPYSINCLWEFKGTPGNTIVLQFHKLQNYDAILKKSLTIYECDLECTTIKDSITMDSPLKIYDKSVKIEFNTVNDISNVVFELYWRIEGCVHTIEATEGIVLSPNYPKNYDNKLRCMWKIITDSGTRAQLVLHHWNFEPSKNCQFDALKIYGGSNEKSQQLLLLCGGKGKLNFPRTITSGYNTMYITLSTDDGIAYSGFNASFRQINNIESNVCDVAIDGFYGYIYSPGYPDFYQNKQNCTTTVHVHANFRVAIKFLHFDLEEGCNFDSVRMYQSDMTIIKQLCLEPGHFPNDSAFASHDNTIIVNFESDKSNVYTGFRAVYYQICDATVQSEFGTMATPDYMTVMMMASRSACNWTIQGPSSEHRVFLIFFELAWNTTDEACLEHLIQISDDADNAVSDKKEVVEMDRSTPYYSGCCGPPPTPIISKGSFLSVEMLGVGDIWFSAFYHLLSPECLRQLGDHCCDLEGNRTYDACTKYVKLDVDNGFSFYITYRNFTSVKSNVTCNTNFLEIHQDGFDGTRLRTICRQNIPMGIFQTSEEKYVVVYLVDEAPEQQAKDTSADPENKNGNQNDCTEDHCRQEINLKIIYAAIILLASVAVVGMLRGWIQIRDQRLKTQDEDTQIPPMETVSISVEIDKKCADPSHEN